ncbi:hypothetical protein [Enterococcus casseliflavus]|uniref:hypothetical protein n=1 Tax=Enterococcus casseliflavus TaxID=37734 RepID=UPI001E4BE883|nr:hypothetical protein [Enterococcus casseliflavus]MCD4961218.1 hypothetical protein [Enterococcus casseliflavus]
MVQEQILKGEAAYLKSLTRRNDVSLEEIEAARNKLSNKVKGVKLDQAIEHHARTVHAF